LLPWIVKPKGTDLFVHMLVAIDFRIPNKSVPFGSLVTVILSLVEPAQCIQLRQFSVAADGSVIDEERGKKWCQSTFNSNITRKCALTPFLCHFSVDSSI
jgi:hypothetical protein